MFAIMYKRDDSPGNTSWDVGRYFESLVEAQTYVETMHSDAVRLFLANEEKFDNMTNRDKKRIAKQYGEIYDPDTIDTVTRRTLGWMDHSWMIVEIPIKIWYSGEIDSRTSEKLVKPSFSNS